ncbi:MAG: putative O-glycosylation ligase, exosortase A system-associated [Rubritepida sp.]|nr:putative O-glycosylation ligase, exosortase A system-associated [Rubritepida sp.]
MRDYFFAMLIGVIVLMACARPFVGVLLWSWISFMSVHRLTWGVVTNLPWAILAFGATLVGCLIAREPKRLRITGVMVLLLMFGIGITITTFTALTDPHGAWQKWDKIIKIVIGLLLTGVLLTERWRIHALIWLIVISLGYFGVRGGLFTILTGGGHIVLGPPDSMIADRNHLAVALLFAIPLINWLRMHSAHRIVQIGLLASMPLMLFAAIGTQSRGALVAVAGVAVLLWLRTPGKIVSGIGIALAVALVVTFMPDSWVQRMQTIRDFEGDRSAMGRLDIWHTSFVIALARPLTGGGFLAMYQGHIVDMFTPGITPRAAHSIYFEVIGEHGFVIFGLWLAIIGLGIYYTMQLTALGKNRPSLRWAADLGRMSQVSIAAYLIGGAFLSLSYWDCFWTLIVVLGAARAIALEEVRQGQAPVVAGRPARAAGPGALPGWRDRPVTARTARG